MAILLLLGFVYLVFWWFVVSELMGRKDEDFPGRYDKALWVILIVFVPVFGMILYAVTGQPVSHKSPGALERKWEKIQAERGRKRAGEGLRARVA